MSTTSVISTQVFWQIVPNSWCSNTKTCIQSLSSLITSILSDDKPKKLTLTMCKITLVVSDIIRDVKHFVQNLNSLRNSFTMRKSK